MKPDWKDAPDAARYLAMDSSGYWYWYQDCPMWNDDMGRWAYVGKSWPASQLAFNASETLEQRP